MSSKRSPQISEDVNEMCLVEHGFVFVCKTLIAACEGLNVKDEPVGRR